MISNRSHIRHLLLAIALGLIAAAGETLEGTPSRAATAGCMMLSGVLIGAWMVRSWPTTTWLGWNGPTPRSAGRSTARCCWRTWLSPALRPKAATRRRELAALMDTLPGFEDVA